MSGWRSVRCVACLLVIVLGFALAGGCTSQALRSFQREPELPVHQLLYKQLGALPADWTLEKPDIWTDTDFTWARWAVVVNFEYKDGSDFAGEEIHIFANPFLARITRYPSPSSLSAGEGYMPQGWTYRPPHAQRFEFGCTGGDGANQPEGCSLILRYEEYVIVLSTPIAEYMTLEDLRRLLEVIDREMADFLQHSTLRPGPRKVPESLDP